MLNQHFHNSTQQSLFIFCFNENKMQVVLFCLVFWLSALLPCCQAQDSTVNKDTLEWIHHALAQEGATLAALSESSTTHHFAALWTTHVNHFTTHQETTTDFLMPKLTGKVESLRQQDQEWLMASYQNLQDLQEQIGRALESSSSKLHSSSNSTSSSLSTPQLLQDYANALQQHFDTKNTHVFVPSRAALSDLEWAWTMQRYMEKGGVDMGSFIYHMGGEDAFRTGWMAVCKLPQVLWKWYFVHAFQRFVDAWHAPVQALSSSESVLS